MFWGSEADFLTEIQDAQFVNRLELHLLQYAADARWRSEWSARRYAGNGLFVEYGSTTTDDLYVDGRIALNLFPAARFQLRYDRRDHQDGRFDVSDQRFDALWYAGSGFALVLSGWPAFEKEDASMGGGIRIGAPRSRNALDLRVMSEHAVWNWKTEGDVRITRRPVRLLADGFFEAGPWRVHGSIDLGLEYAARETGPGGRSTRGYQRYGDVELEYARGEWSAGARLTGGALARAQAEPAGAGYHLDRTWGRGVLALRRELGRWSASALAGWASQRDDLSSPGVPSADYVLDSFLWGAEGSLQATRGLQVRLGYLASSQRGRRTVEVPGPLPAGDANLYFDKAHVRAVYAFQPGMSIEALLSQALRAGRFGGGSVKAVFVL